MTKEHITFGQRLSDMPHYRCRECWKRFDSRADLEYHEEMENCSESTKEGTRQEQSQQGSSSPRGLRGDTVRNAEGTVWEYKDDSGYGFITTPDLKGELVGDGDPTREVFFHITEINAESIQEGDRLLFDIVESDSGLQCRNGEIIQKASDKNIADGTRDYANRHGFGHQKDDRKTGAGSKVSDSSERDIEDFDDERKFR